VSLSVKKIKSTQQSTIDDAGLILLSDQLEKKVHLVYPSLSKVRSSGRYNKESEQMGMEMGKGLSIRKGLTDSDTEALNTPVLSLT